MLRSSVNSVISAGINVLKQAAHQSIVTNNVEANLSVNAKGQLKEIEQTYGKPIEKRAIGEDRIAYTYKKDGIEKTVIVSMNEVAYTFERDVNGDIVEGSIKVGEEYVNAKVFAAGQGLLRLGFDEGTFTANELYKEIVLDSEGLLYSETYYNSLATGSGLKSPFEVYYDEYGNVKDYGYGDSWAEYYLKPEVGENLYNQILVLAGDGNPIKLSDVELVFEENGIDADAAESFLSGIKNYAANTLETLNYGVNLVKDFVLGRNIAMEWGMDMFVKMYLTPDYSRVPISRNFEGYGKYLDYSSSANNDLEHLVEGALIRKKYGQHNGRISELQNELVLRSTLVEYLSRPVDNNPNTYKELVTMENMISEQFQATNGALIFEAGNGMSSFYADDIGLKSPPSGIDASFNVFEDAYKTSTGGDSIISRDWEVSFYNAILLTIRKRLELLKR